MAKYSSPRRGSLAFYPRKRTRRIYPVVRTVPEVAEPKPLVFAGYKAGMTYVVGVETYKNSPNYGQRITIPVTIVECPPLFVYGIRLYKDTPYGRKTLTDFIVKNPPKYLSRKLSLPKNPKEIDESLVEKADDIKLLVCTQPWLINRKKTPEVFEVPLGGSKEEKWEKAKELFGKEIHISDVFKEGDYVDVIGVTKGHGFTGVIKRFGVTRQPRKAKGHVRHVGTIGAWTPSRVLWTVPMAGQYGFFRRTEYNKRILKIGTNGEEITPKGGIPHYGIVRSEYILIAGSVPGPKKRLIMVRPAIRGGEDKPMPTIEYISTSPQQ